MAIESRSHGHRLFLLQYVPLSSWLRRKASTNIYSSRYLHCLDVSRKLSVAKIFSSCFDLSLSLLIHIDVSDFFGGIKWFLCYIYHNFRILPLKSVIPNFVACWVFFGIPFSFIKLISSSDTSTKREAAILKICPPATITSGEVIIAEYDAILGHWERENFYNHLSNYTNYQRSFRLLQTIVKELWTQKVF